MQQLIKIIKQFEGCKLKAYTCPAGILTCGWGSTGKDINKYTTWTQEYADHRLMKDAEYFWYQSAKISPILLLNEDAHTAIADFCYNLGLTRYKASTLRKRIDSSDGRVKEEILKWVWGGGRRLPGLVLRRKAEANLLN